MNSEIAVDVDIRIGFTRCLDGSTQLNNDVSYRFIIDCGVARVECGMQSTCKSMRSHSSSEEPAAATRFRSVTPGSLCSISLVDGDDGHQFKLPDIDNKTLRGVSHGFTLYLKSSSIPLKVFIRYIKVEREYGKSLVAILDNINDFVITERSVPISTSSSIRLSVDPHDLILEMNSWIVEVGGIRPFSVDWHPWEIYSLLRFFSRSLVGRVDSIDVMDFKEYSGKSPCYFNGHADEWFGFEEADIDYHEVEDEREENELLCWMNSRPGYKGYNFNGAYDSGVILGGPQERGCPVCMFVHAPEELVGDEWERERSKQPPPAAEWWKYGHWPPKKSARLFQKVLEKVVLSRGGRPHPLGDRSVTVFELCKALFKIMGEYKPPSTTPEVRTGALLQAHLVFKAFDYDRSGCMDELELKRVFLSLEKGDAELAVEEVALLFDRLADPNNSRLLDVQLADSTTPSQLNKRTLANILCETAERSNSQFIFFAINLSHITTWKLFKPVGKCGVVSCCLPESNPVSGFPSCTPLVWTCCAEEMPQFTELPPGKTQVETPQELFLLFLAFSSQKEDPLAEMELDSFLSFLDNPAFVIRGSCISLSDIQRFQIPKKLVPSFNKDGSFTCNLQLAWRRRPLQKNEKMSCVGSYCKKLIDTRGCLIPLNSVEEEMLSLGLKCSVCGSKSIFVGCSYLLEEGGEADDGRHEILCRSCYHNESPFRTPDRSKAEALFRRLDDEGDRNGKLSRSELLCGVLESIGRLQSGADSDVIRQTAGDLFVKVFFTYHDTDNSGTLSLSELKEMMLLINSTFIYEDGDRIEQESSTKARELMTDLKAAYLDHVKQYKLSNNNIAPPHHSVSVECLKDEVINEDLLKVILTYREKGKSTPKWGVLVPYFSHMMTFPQQKKRICYLKPFRASVPECCVCNMCLLYDAEIDDRPKYHIDACAPSSCSIC